MLGLCSSMQGSLYGGCWGSVRAPFARDMGVVYFLQGVCRDMLVCRGSVLGLGFGFRLGVVAFQG